MNEFGIKCISNCGQMHAWNWIPLKIMHVYLFQFLKKSVAQMNNAMGKRKFC